MWVKSTLGEQRKLLTGIIEPSLVSIAHQCAVVWDDVDQIDAILKAQFSNTPYLQLLYIIDKEGKQVSSNVSPCGIDVSYRGQDLSRRPYAVSLAPKRCFSLSSVYISQTTGRPSISAVQPVMNESKFLGFLIGDFDIRHLPLNIPQPRPVVSLSQLQEEGTAAAPAIPPTVKRIFSLIDQHRYKIHAMVEKLILEHGIFHCTINYTNGQIALWHFNDPYRYHLHSVEDLLDCNLTNQYPYLDYAEPATVTAKQICECFGRFSELRMQSADNYLCSSSLNVVNGMIELTFSDNHQQYLPVKTFLTTDLKHYSERQANYG